MLFLSIYKPVPVGNIHKPLIVTLLEKHAHSIVRRVQLAVVGKGFGAAAEMALARPLTLHTHGALFFQLSDSAAALVDERSLTQKSMQIIPEHIAPVDAHGFRVACDGVAEEDPAVAVDIGGVIGACAGGSIVRQLTAAMAFGKDIYILFARSAPPERPDIEIHFNSSWTDVQALAFSCNSGDKSLI